jgi:hypothetical protein
VIRKSPLDRSFVELDEQGGTGDPRPTPTLTIRDVAELNDTILESLTLWMSHPVIAAHLDNFESAIARRTRLLALTYLPAARRACRRRAAVESVKGCWSGNSGCGARGGLTVAAPVPPAYNMRRALGSSGVRYNPSRGRIAGGISIGA